MCHGIRIVEIQQRQTGWLRQAIRAVGAQGYDRGIVRILRGLACVEAPNLDLRQVGMLEAFDQYPVAVGQLRDELVDRGLAAHLVLADLRQPAVGSHHHLEGARSPMPPRVLAGVVDIEIVMRMLDDRDALAGKPEPCDQMLDQRGLAGTRIAAEADDLHHCPAPPSAPRTAQKV